jgi:hypothetical protein
MSWKAFRIPLFLGIGLAAPGLIVLGIQNVPRDLIVFRATEVPQPRIFKLTEPVTFAMRSPAPGLDPFRHVLPKGSRAPRVFVEQATIQVPVLPSPAAIQPTVRPLPATAPLPEPDLPDPKLEGVVAGDDPVAVIKVGEESQFVRVGQKLSGGLQVLSITDGEVRLRRGTSELVLKTGIR